MQTPTTPHTTHQHTSHTPTHPHTHTPTNTRTHTNTPTHTNAHTHQHTHRAHATHTRTHNTPCHTQTRNTIHNHTTQSSPSFGAQDLCSCSKHSQDHGRLQVHITCGECFARVSATLLVFTPEWFFIALLFDRLFLERLMMYRVFLE